MTSRREIIVLDSPSPEPHIARDFEGSPKRINFYPAANPESSASDAGISSRHLSTADVSARSEERSGVPLNLADQFRREASERPDSSSDDVILLGESASGDAGEEEMSQEEADLLLARAVQEQECAFLLLQQHQQPRLGTGRFGGSQLPAGREAARDVEDESGNRNLVSDSGRGVASLQQAGVGAARNLQDGPEEGGGGEGEEELSDEEFARRLQEEEEREMEARFLALAGYRNPRPGGVMVALAREGDLDEFGEGEDEDEEEEEEEVELDGRDMRHLRMYANGALDVDSMSYEELSALGEAIGTHTKGLPTQVIDGLPRSTFIASGPKDEASPRKEAEDEICAICRCEYEDGDKLILLPSCHHNYHAECIQHWLNLNKVCPICKSEVSHTPVSNKNRGKPRQSIRRG